MKQKIEKIHPNIKWFAVSSRGRNHAILFIDAAGIVANLKDYNRKIYGVDHQIEHYRQFDGSRYISLDDYDILKKFYAKIINTDPVFLYRVGLKIEKNGQLFVKFVDKHKNTDWTRLSNGRLVEVLEKLSDLEARVWGGPWIYGWYFFFNDIYLEEFKNQLEKKLKNDFKEIWNYILTPEKLTFIGQEKLALLKLAKGKVSTGKIKTHLKKFAFVNKYYFWGTGFTFDDISKRIKDLTKKGDRYIKKEINSFKIKSLNLNKYPFSKEERLVIKGFKKMAYSANFADEVTNYSTYHLKSFFDEMAKRLKISYKELVSMRLAEIVHSLKIGEAVVSREELKERLANHALILSKNKVYVLTGKAFKEYKKREPQEEIKLAAKELKGTTAFIGKSVKGNVRIIKSDEEIKYFKKGEILVTPMTNPTYLPAMQKSKAIVTDEGGLLCHAAIVSRELGISCIIGTKVASKVLKDGDLVEVDANNGIVKILKRK